MSRRCPSGEAATPHTGQETARLPSTFPVQLTARSTNLSWTLESLNHSSDWPAGGTWMGVTAMSDTGCVTVGCCLGYTMSDATAPTATAASTSPTTTRRLAERGRSGVSCICVGSRAAGLPWEVAAEKPYTLEFHRRRCRAMENQWACNLAGREPARGPDPLKEVMAPIRETAPASGSPLSGTPVPAPAAPSHALPLEAPTRDFVGWTAQPELRTSRRLSVEVTRKVLATALGLDTEVLAGLDAAQLRSALHRLLAMAAYTYKLVGVAAP